MKLNRREMASAKKALAAYWGLFEKEVHVSTKGRVTIDRPTEKTPSLKHAKPIGIVIWDGEDLYEYLEEHGL